MRYKGNTIRKDKNNAIVIANYLKMVMDNNPERLEASYGKLIPILAKAIQELSVKVTALEAG